MNVQPGDILLQRAKGPIGWGIELFAGKYSHALVAYDTWLIVDVTWPGGGRYQSVDEVGRADVYRYESGLDQEQVEEAKAFLDRAAMTSYDIPQLLGYVPATLLSPFGRWGDTWWNSKNRYICSEVADRMYQRCGIDLAPDVKPGAITPYQLSEALTFIGRIG